MKLLVVLPFCAADAHRAEALIDWIIELGGCKENGCLLVSSSGTSAAVRAKVFSKAQAAFGAGSNIATPFALKDEKHPIGPNWMFETTLKHFAKNRIGTPFLWLEPDCVPMRQGWLQEIETEYAKVPVATPIMARIIALNDPKYPKRIPSGIAVYPADAWKYYSAMQFRRDVAWDVGFADIVAKLVSPSETILSRMNHDDAPTFVEKREPKHGRNAMLISQIPKQSALFHPNKDGTLIELLRKQLPPKKSVAPKPHIGRKRETCIVCLGRYGDILSALPIAKHYAAEGPVSFLVARQFADILDGVSYVRPEVWDGDYSDMAGACQFAETRFRNVIRAQIFGTPEALKDKASAHNRQAWKLAGCEKVWDQLPLVIDRRDPVRERELISKHVTKSTEPLLLTMLTGGVSGAFAGGAALQAKIELAFKDRFQIVDLAKIKATRIYDLLGLYENAVALVTIDSATHHLAAAHKVLPCAVLLPDDAYQSAEPRCNASLVLRYSETAKHFNEISAWLAFFVNPPKFIHTYEHHNYNAREIRMQSTWTALRDGLGWVGWPFSEPYPEDSREIGDPRGVPFVNDLLDSALSASTNPMDVIVLTNSDIALLPEIQKDILAQLSVFPATCSSRRDVKTFADIAKAQPSKDHVHWGRDLFAFRAWWLAKHLPALPRMLLGSNEWDNMFLNLIRKEAGVLIPGVWNNPHAYTCTSVEMASPNVLHEDHVPFADKPENKHGPHNAWNRLQLLKWSRKYCPELRFVYAEETEALYKKTKKTFKPI